MSRTQPINQDRNNKQMLFLSFVNGMLIKFLDDSLDIDLIKDKQIIQILETSIIALTALISSNDIFYGLIAASALTRSYMTNGVDNEYWKALIIAPLIGVLFSYKDIFTSFSFVQIGLFLYMVITYIIFDYLDTTYFPEDVSINKLYMRFGFIVLGTMHFLSKTFRETKGSGTFLMTNLGYLTASCLVQVYMLFIKKDDNENSSGS